jgi:hypothetical protein
MRSAQFAVGVTNVAGCFAIRAMSRVFSSLHHTISMVSTHQREGGDVRACTHLIVEQHVYAMLSSLLLPCLLLLLERFCVVQATSVA